MTVASTHAQQIVALRRFRMLFFESLCEDFLLNYVWYLLAITLQQFVRTLLVSLLFLHDYLMVLYCFCAATTFIPFFSYT